MILPIGDAPDTRGAAPVTWLLIGVNVAVYFLISVPLGQSRPVPGDPLLTEYLRAMSVALGNSVSVVDLARQVTDYDLFVFAWGYRPSHPSAIDLLTCMFLHGGFFHLAGNMLFLWIYGDNVEHRLGPTRFLAAYLGTGIAATLFHQLFAAGSPIPLVGASGAISGILGFYFLWFPRNQVRLLWLLPPFIMQVFEVPARLVLGLYLIADNLLPFLATGDASGVAHGAHIGGFLAGLVAAAVGRRLGTEVVPAGFRPAPGDAAPAPITVVRALIDAGRLDEAAAAYFAEPSAVRGSLPGPEALELGTWLRSAGHADAALAVARRRLREAPDGPESAALHLLAGLVLLEDLDQAATAFQHLLRALEIDPRGPAAPAARAALERIDALQKRQVGRLHRPHRW